MARYGADEAGDCSGSTAKAIFDRYTVYVGTLIAPKSLFPVAVYVAEDSARFFVFTPNRKYLIGGGYFGDTDGPAEATRQHMLPGLCRGADHGAGLGTTLYLAGNMVNALKYEQGNAVPELRSLSYVYRDATYSKTGGRSAYADRAWEKLNEHDLSDFEAGGDRSLYMEADAADVLSDSDAANMIENYYRGSDEEPGAPVEVQEIEGTITITASVEDQDVDLMEWDTVKESGLVLHLGPFFDEPDAHAVIPPEVFGRLDWSQTRMSQILEFAEQNASALVAEQSFTGKNEAERLAAEEEVAKRWMRDAARSARESGWGEVAEALLDRIAEGAQLWVPGAEPPRLTGNPGALAMNPAFAREWEDVYGAHTSWA